MNISFFELVSPRIFFLFSLRRQRHLWRKVEPPRVRMRGRIRGEPVQGVQRGNTGLEKAVGRTVVTGFSLLVYCSLGGQSFVLI